MPKKKIDYAAMFTLRKDGRYCKRLPDGRYLYDKDPEALFRKVEAAKPRAMTFKEVAEDWEVNHVEKLERSSQATYRAPLREAIKQFGEKPIDEIDAADIDRILLAEKDKGYSYKHAAMTKSIYKQIFDRAIILRQIKHNPCSAVRVPRGLAKGTVEAPTEEVQKTISRNLDKPGGRFIAFLLYSGMRTQEIAALRWGDVDEKHGTIRIDRAADLHGTPIIKDTKTENGRREIPILDALRPFIARPKGAKPDDYIFNRNGKIMTRSQINTLYINWCRAAGLAHQVVFTNRHRGKKECTRHEWRPDINLHQFRHNFATVCIEQDLDDMAIQELMGHADVGFTKKQYATLRARKKASEVAKLNAGFM